MKNRRLDDAMAVAGQISAEDVAEAAADGVAMIVNLGRRMHYQP